MGDCLRVYNVADVVSFIEAFRKTAEQYYPDIEEDITRIRSHAYGEKSKLTKSFIGYNANALYLYCSGDQKRIAKFSKDVLKEKFLGFPQADIELPHELYDKFSKMAPLFIVQVIPDCNIPKEMNIYKEKTGKKTIKVTKKLLGAMKIMGVILYTPLIKWYLDHGFRLRAVHKMVEYEPGKTFSWFPEEVANTRREAHKDPLKKQLGDVGKLKGNSFYEKMIEDFGRHKSTKFTRRERTVDKALRSQFFNDLEGIGGAYVIKEFKRTVMIKRHYQCGIAVYQPAKL